MAQQDATTRPRKKAFAPIYRETTKEIGFNDINEVRLQHHATDFTYRTRLGSKTVRCTGALETASYNKGPEGFYTFWDGETKYGYHPDERRLITLTRDTHRTVAREDDIFKLEAVTYGKRAPVEGGIEEDVEATIYYRSPRSDEMQSVTITVDYLEGKSDAIINGKEVGTGRRIEAVARWERDIKSKVGTKEYSLGKVARVEFPRGHRFTITAEGLEDGRREFSQQKLERAVSKAFDRDIEATVEYDGALSWDDE